jgi:hypothetical protein
MLVTVWTANVRLPANLSLFHGVQTGFGAHPASSPARHRGQYRRDIKLAHSLPSSAEVKNGGGIPPFLHTSSWCGPWLIMRRNNCAFTFLPWIYIYKGKDIPVTGHEGPCGCETSRLPHFLNNRFTDVGEDVSPTRRPLFTPRKIPGSHFC